MSRRILLLGAKETLIPAVHKAQDMGLFTVVADGNPNAAGLAYADMGIVCDISNVEAVVSLARNQAVDGVLSLSEFGVLAAATAAAELGLPGISPDTAARATNKGLMRTAWRTAALPQPQFRVVRDLEGATTALESLGLPLICKPCWNSAARGVTRVNLPTQLQRALHNAMRYDPSNQAILEQCVPGLELSCESFVSNGRLHLLALADKDVERDGPTCVTWSLTYPPDVWDQHGERLQAILDQAARALGIDRGCCHAEVMFDGNEFSLLEMAARGGGGHIYTTIVEHVSGVDYVGASIRHAMGEAVDIRPTRRAAACYRFLRAPEGKLQRIIGLQEAAAVQHVHDIGVIVQPGDELTKVTNGADRPGWVVTLAANRQEVVEAAEKASRLIRFETHRPVRDKVRATDGRASR